MQILRCECGAPQRPRLVRLDAMGDELCARSGWSLRVVRLVIQRTTPLRPCWYRKRCRRGPLQITSNVALKAQRTGVDDTRFRRISALDAADLEEFLAAAL
jgi:hypothetical protein